MFHTHSFLIGKGTVVYMAPEMRTILSGNNPQYGIDMLNLEKMDVFSVGLIILEALFSIDKEQFALMSTYQDGERIIAEKLNLIKSKELKNTIAGVLKFNPKERFDILKTILYTTEIKIPEEITNK